MALDIRSFFIGIATVFGILAVGFGGGVLMGGIMSGGDTKSPNKIERQASKEMPPVAAAQTPAVTQSQPAADPPKDVDALAKSLKEIKPAKPITIAEPVKAEPATPAITQTTPQPPPQSGHAQAAPAMPTPAPAVQPPQPQASAPVITLQRPQPTVGPQRPVALTQPGFDERPRLSRREEARLRAYERREQRRVQREQRRKQMADRYRQEQMRQEQLRQDETKAAQQLPRRQTVDDDDDDEPPIARRGGFFGGGPFGLFNDSN